MSNVIVFDLDGVITSEEAYWTIAGLVLHELLYSPRYWNIGRTNAPYQPPTTEEACWQVSHEVLPEAVIVGLKARSVNSNWDTCYVGVYITLIDLLARIPDCTPLLPLCPWEAEWIASFRNALAQLPGSPTVTPERYDRLNDPVFDGAVGLELIERLNVYTRTVLVAQTAEAGRGQVLEAERPQGAAGRPQGIAPTIHDQPANGYSRGEACPRPAPLQRPVSREATIHGQVVVEDVFGRYSPSWVFCQDLFQEWYLGDELYMQAHGRAPAQTGKRGCIYFERPLLPMERLQHTLSVLRERGYSLGVATGRPGQEAILPLKNYGLYQYFDEKRVKTHAEVAEAEAALRRQGETLSLVKPHPYQFLVATDHHYQPGWPLPARGSFIVVGDTPSDVQGGKAAGALTIAVLTGARTPQARKILEQSRPDFIVDDVTHVPTLLERLDDLATIQRMQFTEREKAELLLQRWFARHMDLVVESVTLMPKAVSLNSFNGIYRSNGEEYFFKTHVEEQGILAEYYHAELLANAGYNIVRPLRTIHEQGQQMVIYPVVRDPVMFDLMRAVETGQSTEVTVEMLVAAERHECERLLSIYHETLEWSTGEEHARAPIHQLFWHRLMGGRLSHFYAGKLVPFPQQQEEQNEQSGRNRARLVLAPTIPQQPGAQNEQGGLLWEDLLTYRWIINGNDAGEQVTLASLIERANRVLRPEQAAATIIGHGDAHFGNVFLEQHRYYRYFDPAFAGRHAALLDIVKPLFHNVWATWMYFPDDVARDLQLTVTVRDRTLIIEHNYQLTPVRQAIWQTKIEHLVRPLIDLLRTRAMPVAEWQEVIRMALLCCPLLTVNLLDTVKRPPAICWLGLAQTVQMGTIANLGDDQLI